MIAEEMSNIQGKLNAVVGGPYVTTSGVTKYVTRRAATLRVASSFAKMSSPMLNTAILDDFLMLQKVEIRVEKAGAFTEETAKAMSKYADRLLVSAGQIGGIDVAKVSASRALFENFKDPLRRVTGWRKMPPHRQMQHAFWRWQRKAWRLLVKS